MTCTRQRWGWCGALILLACGFALSASRARAQTCGGDDDDDGGMICLGGDDGGEPAPTTDNDGGPMSMEPDMGGAGGMSGASGFGGAGGQAGQAGQVGMDGGVSDRDQCSCDATVDDAKQGRIHVCTEGQTRAACADFSCERGRVNPNALCSHSNIRLCCAMNARHLVSVLYDDCTHANCQAGFIQQCNDFGGELHGSDCDALVEDNADSDDGGGGGCAVRNAEAGDELGWLALGLLGLVRARRRARKLGA